jgi:chromosome segregation ATPase
MAQLELDLSSRQTQIAELENRCAEAEATVARSARDQALTADENTALKKRLDETGAEVARLARSEASLVGNLSAERARTAADQAESARAIRVLEVQNETARSEASVIQTKFEASDARGTRLNQINIDLSAKIAEFQALIVTADRQLIETQTKLVRALEQVKALEASAEESRQNLSATEAARLAAVDRAEQHSKALATLEKAHKRSEERAERLLTQLHDLQQERQMQVDTLEAAHAEVKSSIESAKTEYAIMASALETARKERTERVRSGHKIGSQTIKKIEAS